MLRGCRGVGGNTSIEASDRRSSKGELSFHASPHHPRGPALGSEKRTPRADLGMSRGLGSLHLPALSLRGCADCLVPQPPASSNPRGDEAQADPGPD